MLGFFAGVKSWVKRNIRTIASVASFICPPVGAAINTAIDSGVFDDWKMDVSDLSPSDGAIIGPWDDNHFTPWYTSILYTIQNNVLNKALNITTRAQFANDVILKVTAVQLYYASYDTAGLSAKAINERLQYINAAINGIFDTIYNDPDLTAFGDTYNFVNVTKNFNSIDLSILAPPAANPDFTDTYQLYNVSTNVANLTPSVTTIAANPIPSVASIKATVEQIKGTGDLTEAAPIGTITPASTTNIASTTASSVATTQNTPTASNTTSTNASKNTGLKVFGFIAISVLLLKLGFGSSSKSSKNN